MFQTFLTLPLMFPVPPISRSASQLHTHVFAVSLRQQAYPLMLLRMWSKKP